MLRSTVGFYSNGKPRSRNRARDARFYTRLSQLGWLEATARNSQKPTEVPLMPIIRHDSTGKVTPTRSWGPLTMEEIIDECSHEELNREASRRQLPYDKFLAKLREDDTHGTGD